MKKRYKTRVIGTMCALKEKVTPDLHCQPHFWTPLLQSLKPLQQLVEKIKFKTIHVFFEDVC